MTGPTTGVARPARPDDTSGPEGRRSTRLELTPVGRSVAWGVVPVLLAGLVLNYRELVVIAVMGLVALLVAALFVAYRPPLRVRRTVSPVRVERGDPSRAELSLGAADGRRPQFRSRSRYLWGLTVRDRVDGRPIEWHLPHVVLSSLVTGTDGGAESAGIRYDLPTRRRGAVQVGPVGMVRVDPLGLCRAELVAGEVTELWVQPRIYSLAPLSSGRRRDLEGPTHERASGTITFDSLREYVVGDDLRLVHWPSTARAGTLVVRSNVDPSQPRATVVLDTREASYAGEESFEAAVDAAASVLVASTGRRFPVRLITGGGLEVDAGHTRVAERELLDTLTRVRQGPDHGPAALTGRLTRDGGGVSLVVVTGRDGRAEAQHLARAASRRYESLAVVCLDPDVTPGAVRRREVLDLAAADGPAFAALWREAA